MLWNKQLLHTERSLGLLLSCNFWRKYLHLTCKSFSKSLCIFFVKIANFGRSSW